MGLLGEPNTPGAFTIDHPEYVESKTSGYFRLNALEYYNCYGKSFFLTDKGYMDLGPGELCNSDKVAILYGCEVLFILRKIDDHYTLLGKFVQGLWTARQWKC
jgi:hypothetical protein